MFTLIICIKKLDTYNFIYSTYFFKSAIFLSSSVNLFPEISSATSITV